jgi:Holliday junction resolvasome RuvABC endonuclease subunit
MDWARDDFGLSDIDLENVFQYEQKQTTVIKLVESRGVMIARSENEVSCVNRYHSIELKSGRCGLMISGWIGLQM